MIRIMHLDEGKQYIDRQFPCVFLLCFVGVFFLVSFSRLFCFVFICFCFYFVVFSCLFVFSIFLAFCFLLFLTFF
jgi:hypothetical protein